MAQEIRVPLAAIQAQTPATQPTDVRVPVGAITNQAPDFTTTNETDAQGNPVVAFGKEALAGFNPVTINRAIQQAFWHPIETAKGVLSAQDKVRQDALNRFQQGDYVGGTAKMIDWLIPLLGPRLSESGDLLQKGETARGLGAATDVGLQVAVPSALKNLPNMRVSPAMRPRNVVAAEAVAFGERQGIPLDAGTATGRPVIQTIQKRASDSIGGAGVAENFKIRQADRLATVGEQQAARAYPQAPVSPEQAGTAIRQGVRQTIAKLNAEADAAYGELRNIEAGAPSQTRSVTPGSPFQAMKLAVDMRPVRQALQGLYKDLLREAELVPLQGSRAKALTALDRLMNGPDFAPLSTADSALGDLKSLARTDDVLRRTAGQGVAAEAVKALDQAVLDTARKSGPQTVNALMRGRAATVNKYKALDVLDKIAEEPVRAFDQATFRRDAGIAQLREVEKLAPDALPQVGRAWLDELMARATEGGGFEHAQALLAKWESLGDQTKRLLFRDPAYIKDLDNFFRLAKNISFNPNPSGTARVLSAFNVGAIPASYLTSKLLYSPTGVRLLTQGLRIPVGNKAAITAWTSQVARALGEGATPAPLPAMGDRETTVP